MNHFSLLLTWALIICAAPASAGEKSGIDGFGVAKWGMLKEEILAAEGFPTENDKNTGEITYNNKTVMGKQAIVRYQFEAGCSDFDLSQCRFSDGHYIFGDAPRKFFEHVGESLADKYGLPADVTTSRKAFPSITTKGTSDIETQVSKWTNGKATIIFTRDCSLSDFTSKVTDKEIKAGVCRAVIAYYGPSHYQRMQNERRSKDRDL